MKNLVGVVALALLSACVDSKPLRIAVVEGNGAQFAAVLAVEDINAAGGINGRLLEVGVVTEPERVTPQQALATADSLASDAEVLAVVGHGGSATSLVASQVYNAKQVPQIAPSTSSPLYTKAGPYSFRLVASDEHQGEFIAARIAAMGPRTRVAVLYINDDYGRALNESVQAGLRRAGITPVHVAPFIAGEAFERSADDIVKSLTAVSPDLLAWIGLSPELRLLRPRLRASLPRLRVFGSDGVSFIGSAGDGVPFQGDWLVAYTDVNAERPALADVARRFVPLGGRRLTDAAALTYDAVGMIAEAMRAGARTRKAIQQYLDDGARSARAYNGITGSIVLDEHGDARPSYVLLQIEHAGPRVISK